MEAVSTSLEAGQTREEIVENVRLEQYSHLGEYERSIVNNVRAVETMLRFLRER